jgi:hypothetical protein
MLFPTCNVPDLPDYLKWRTLPLKPGESIEGWIAGPVVPVLCHWVRRRSFPCMVHMTSGKLPCQCQLKPTSLRLVGYCPLIDKYKERYVIVLSPLITRAVQQIKAGTCIKFSRPTTAKRPLWHVVLPDTHISGEMSKKMRQISVHDISEYLLHLWQDKALCEHFGKEHRPGFGAGEEADEKKVA